MMLYLMKDLLQLCYMKINTDYLLQPPQDPSLQALLATQ